MSELKQAAEKAVNLGKQLKAVIEVGEFLSSLADLDKLARDARAAADVAVKARNEAQADLENINRQRANSEAALQSLKDQAGKV
ncbi:MAG TPA: hypothetical protein VGF43_20290, partial [Dongiaceae bacterium]